MKRLVFKKFNLSKVLLVILIFSISVLLIWLVVNFNAIKKQLSFNKSENLSNFEQEKRNWINEPNKMEIPALNIIGKLTYPRDTKELDKLVGESITHIPNTTLPGEKGNVGFTAHSSSIHGGRYASIFSTLNKLKENDEIFVYKNNICYTYKVENYKFIWPSDISILSQNEEDRITLITCWPIGTNLKRLVVTARSVK